MMGYADEYETTVLELTYNYGVTEYTKGNAYAQVSFMLYQHSPQHCEFPCWPHYGCNLCFRLQLVLMMYIRVPRL